jgi:hypothetical protein
MLTKDHAIAIAKKLKAKTQDKKGSPHQIQLIFYADKLVAHFGIRHGSKRNAGHDHIPKSLYVSPYFCRELACCTRYLDDWLAEMEKQGKLK